MHTYMHVFVSSLVWRVGVCLNKQSRICAGVWNTSRQAKDTFFFVSIAYRQWLPSFMFQGVSFLTQLFFPSYELQVEDLWRLFPLSASLPPPFIECDRPLKKKYSILKECNESLNSDTACTDQALGITFSCWNWSILVISVDAPESEQL